MKKRLRREVQCPKCPWLKATDPREIPNGYSERAHRALCSTIARPGEFSTKLPPMACHESQPGDEEYYCIGWLVNQLGPGNNIGLRIKMLNYDLSRVRLRGDNHEEFSETLPK